MALPVWSQLEKSTDDPQTIAAAIAAAIAAHEQDPTAHLGDGESLSAHKHELVIDHPAQSVVLDKIPFDYYMMNEGELGALGWSFEEGTGWEIDGRIVGASLFSETHVIVISQFPWSGGDDYPDNDLMFQFFLQVNGMQETDGDFMFSMGEDGIFGNYLIRIEKDGKDLYLRFIDHGTVVQEYLLGSNSITYQYLRFYFDSAHERVVVYRGYTPVISFETSDWKKWIPYATAVDMSRTTNQSVSFSMRNWKATFVRDLDI